MRDWLRKSGRSIGMWAVVGLAGILVGVLLYQGIETLVERVADGSPPSTTQEQDAREDSSGDSPQPRDSTGARLMNAWPVDSSYAVAARGQMVYLGNGAFLDVADFSDMQRPVRKGRVALPATPRGIVLGGDFAYVALSDSAASGDGSDRAARGTGGVFGVRAVDISDPAAPQVVGVFDTGEPIEELAVARGHAYVAVGQRGLRVLDVSDPRRMREVGAYMSASPGGKVSGVAVAGGYAYLAAGEAGLRVVDVSDSSAPSLRHTFHVGGMAKSVAVSGARAFLSHTVRSIKDSDGTLNSDWFDQGFTVFDISRPAHPKRVGVLENGPLTGDVWAEGDRAYFDTGLDGIRIVDFSNPADPCNIGSFRILVSDVAATSTHVYLAEGTKGLYIWKRPRQACLPDGNGSERPSKIPSK